MEYLITFLEGVISFISPCMLPMLPLYLSYFGGVRDERRQEGQDGQGGIKISRTVRGAAAFVTGFTIVFCLLLWQQPRHLPGHDLSNKLKM